MLRAVLLDVGGTLWPDRLAPASGPDGRLERVRILLPGTDPRQALDSFSRHLQRASEPLEQDVAGAVRDGLAELGLDPSRVSWRAVVRALCEPAVLRLQLFPGARELLLTIRELGFRCVILSNTTFRGAAEYGDDFVDLGVGELIDRIVTSMDVGYRKPHPAIFAAALTAGGCAPDACVMVGNSELNDIQPAKLLGMRSIRVAIEEPPPQTTAAEFVGATLSDVSSTLRRWAATDEHATLGGR